MTEHGKAELAAGDSIASQGAEIEALRADLRRAEEARGKGNLHEADGIALDILTRAPGLPEAIALRAFVAATRNDVDRAIFMLEAVTAKRREPSWLCLLSSLYRRRFRFDDALRVARLAAGAAKDAARLDPLLELARAHLDRDEPDDASDTFLAALAVDPDSPAAHLGLGQILLARGEFEPGWREYEWRNKLPEAAGRVPSIKAAAWNGMALPRGRLLIVCDQGYGDAIQFARYLPHAAARAEELVLACSPELEPLFARIEGVSRCVHKWSDIPGFAAHALISSLPGLLGTRADTIPAPTAYLATDPERAAVARDRLLALEGGPKTVGIFWAGRPTHPNNTRRSIQLSMLAPIRDAAPGARFVSLQKDRPEADATALTQARVADLSADLHTFDDTAAILANLDLLITVDSAVAHLAGALGVPVWVLLPSPSDWRWQRGRADSPWYPSMRLYRQPSPGDWTTPIEAAASDLARLVAS
jgi:tetratricopeptide (TPR) repeat protein